MADELPFWKTIERAFEEWTLRIRAAERDEHHRRAVLQPLEPAEGTCEDTQAGLDETTCGVCASDQPVIVRHLVTTRGLVDLAVCESCAKKSDHLLASHAEDEAARVRG